MKHIFIYPLNQFVHSTQFVWSMLRRCKCRGTIIVVAYARMEYYGKKYGKYYCGKLR